jgi:hypothetical protein
MADRSSNIAMFAQIPREILDWPASEKFMFSKTGSLLLDSQVPSSPQLSAGNFFFTEYGCLDQFRIRP